MYVYIELDKLCSCYYCIQRDKLLKEKLKKKEKLAKVHNYTCTYMYTVVYMYMYMYYLGVMPVYIWSVKTAKG